MNTHMTSLANRFHNALKERKKMSQRENENTTVRLGYAGWLLCHSCTC